MPEQVHGSCIDVGGIAVLLRGPPGSGKSDLALRLIDDGAILIADDRVDLVRDGDQVHASAPPPLAGLIEVRGLGIVRRAASGPTALGVVVDLVGHDDIERLPDPARCTLLGIDLPLHRLAPFAASATAKVRLAVEASRHAIVAAP